LFWFDEKLNQLIKNEFLNKKGVKVKIDDIKKKMLSGKTDPFNAASKLFHKNES
jgi:hypothetical protein